MNNRIDKEKTMKKTNEKKRKAAAKKTAAVRKAKKEHELHLKLKQKYEVESGTMLRMQLLA